MTDGMHQVSLAKTLSPINKQRVVSSSRSLGHSQGGGVSEAITLADDKTVKDIARVKS